MLETVQMQLSNLCLDAQTIGMGGVSRHADVLHDIRDGDPLVYPGGYVITPPRVLTADLAWQVRCGQFNNILDPGDENRPPSVFASGVEQSWGPGIPLGTKRAFVQANWSDVPKAAKDVLTSLDFTSGFALHEAFRSVAIMRRIGAILGDPLAVVRAEQPHKGRFINFGYFGFRQTATQIKPGMYIRLAGVQPDSDGRLRPTQRHNKQLRTQLASQRVNGLILDGHWIQAQAESYPGVVLDKSVYEDAVDGFWAPTEESAIGIPLLGMHAAAGREDTKVASDRDRSFLELSAILAGPEALGRTALGDILTMGYRIWRNQLATEWSTVNLGLYNQVTASVQAGHPQARFHDGTRFDEAASIKKEIEYTMRRIQSPPVFPVNVETTHRALARYHKARGRPDMTRADFVSMQRDIAYHLGSFLGLAEATCDQADTFPRLASKLLGQTTA